MQVFHERRSQRSDSKREALMLQLRACARRAGVEAMVLADQQGRIIARSDRLPMADDLASFSPFLAKPKTWFGQMRFDGESRTVAVSPFQLGSSTAFLCAVGAKRRSIGGVFLQATAGVRRIMTT
jgi:hypothetical protein